MIKKGLCYPIVLLILVVFLACSCVAKATFEEINSQIIENVELMMKEIEEEVMSNSLAMMSSNPYTYVMENQYYDNLVKLSYDALPILHAKIKFSRENGLREYILAIAIEEIAKVDLKRGTFQWANGKEFSQVWERHLKTLPYSVRSIVFSSKKDQTKIDELKELGVVAIPFILDYLEQGRLELAPALDELLQETNYLTYDKDLIKDYQQWAATNKAIFDNLRQLVNSQAE